MRSVAQKSRMCSVRCHVASDQVPSRLGKAICFYPFQFFCLSLLIGIDDRIDERRSVPIPRATANLTGIDRISSRDTMASASTTAYSRIHQAGLDHHTIWLSVLEFLSLGKTTVAWIASTTAEWLASLGTDTLQHQQQTSHNISTILARQNYHPEDNSSYLIRIIRSASLGNI